MRLCVLMMAAIAWSPAGRAQPGPAAADPVQDPRVVQALALLEAWLDAEQAYKRLPSVSMAVVHDQRTLWSRAFGLAHLETQAPATPETMYSICSISKLFTGVAVMQQRDAGRLQLDDPVSKHLAWFRIEGAEPGSPPVTVRGLLTHASGLPRESDFPYWTGPEYPFPQRDEVVERLPQQQMLYRSTAAGRPFADVVRTGILEPLGMRETETEHLDRHRGGRLASGYTALRRDGSRERVPPYELRGIGPAAGFTSTVLDLGRFAAWQFRLLATGNTEILDVDSLREMHRLQWMEPDWKTSRGLAFGIWRSGDKTFVGHSGYCPGYQSTLLLQTAEKVATVFMTNTNGIDSQAFAQRAYDIVAPAVKQALDSPGSGKAHDPAFARYVGRYADWLAGETHVLLWDDGLALLPLPTDKPQDALLKLKPVAEHRFRRLRDDGTLGEEVRFEVGADGAVTRLWHHSNYETRVPEAPPRAPAADTP
jgi:CubicO group peptidase (beta-lactamase class C family)